MENARLRSNIGLGRESQRGPCFMTSGNEIVQLRKTRCEKNKEN